MDKLQHRRLEIECIMGPAPVGFANRPIEPY